MKKFLGRAYNVSADNYSNFIITANTQEEAKETFENRKAEVIKNHCLVKFENDILVEITEELKPFVTIKKNGFSVNYDFMNTINNFATTLNELLENMVLSVSHFMYGENLDIITVILKNGNDVGFKLNSFGKIAIDTYKLSHEEFAMINQFITKTNE